MALSDFETAVSMVTSSETEEMLVSDLKNLGEKLFRATEYEKAIWCYSEVIKKKPTEASYHKLRGDCHLKMQHLDLAITDFKNSLHYDPQNNKERLQLSRLLLNLERYNEAMEVSLALNGNELAWLGDELRFEKHKFEEAIRYYTEAIKKDPDNVEFYERRGSCYLKTQDLNLAIADFKTELEKDSKNMSAWNYLIQALLHADRVDEAVQETLDLENGEFVKLLGRKLCYEKSEKAIHLYTQAIRKHSLEALYYRLRGDCYLIMQEFDRAIIDFKKGMELDPNSKKDRVYLSEVLFNSGRYTEAIAEMTATDYIQLTKLGDLFMKYDKFEEAIRCFTEAIGKNAANDAVCYEKRGICNWKLKKAVEAISDFEKSLQLEPINLSVRLYLCVVLTEAGRCNEARESEYKKIFNEPKTEVIKEDIANIEFARRKLKMVEEENQRVRLASERHVSVLYDDVED